MDGKDSRHIEDRVLFILLVYDNSRYFLLYIKWINIQYTMTKLLNRNNFYQWNNIPTFYLFVAFHFDTATNNHINNVG